jgi:hypothetical protein
MGLNAFRVGDKFGYLDEILHNTSSRPVTFTSIRVARHQDGTRKLTVIATTAASR